MTADGSFFLSYPGPWTIEESSSGFTVYDRTGVLLAAVYVTHLPANWTIGQSVRLEREHGRELMAAIAGLAKEPGGA